ncbi:MAG: gliding motility-associated-like protein [Arenicella sp.]|jgi:gliding motility-associated-like protein
MNILKRILLLVLLTPLGSFAQNYNWAQQTSSTAVQLTGMYFINDYEGYCVGNGGVIARTANGGANWEAVNSPTSSTIVGVHFEDLDNGLVSENWGKTYKTVNGGQSWNLVYSHGGLMNSMAGNNGRSFVGCSSEMMYSDNLGDTWDSISMPIFGSIVGISFASDTVGYAVNGASVARTDDNGLSWVSQGVVTVSPYSLSGICAITEDIIVAVGDTGTIVRSIDEGLSWTLTSLPTNENLYAVDFADDSYGIVSGTDNTIYETTDGGLNWTPAPTGNAGHIFGVSCRSNQLAYICGQSGKIYRSPGGLEDIFTSSYSGPNTVCEGSPFDFSFEFENVGAGPSFNPSFTIQETTGLAFMDTTLIYQGTVFNGDVIEMVETGVMLNTPGTYNIIITSTDSINQVNNVITLTILVVAPDEHAVSSVSTFCAGDEIEIVASGGNSYNWIAGITDDLTNPVQIVYPQETTLYKVEITQDYCVVEDSIWLNLEPNCQADGSGTLAFSPNFDGVNDYLVLDFVDLLSDQNAVTIYNRWGDVVFETPNYNNDDSYWDGTYANRPSPAGTYFLIAGTSNDGVVKTWVQIIR